MVVALNPTNGSGCDDVLAQSRIFFENSSDVIVSTAFPPPDDVTGKIHLGAAVLLFVVLAIFNLFVFTATDKTNDLQTKQVNRNKRIRNWIYVICGVFMVITIGTLAYGLTADFKSCDAFSAKTGIFGLVPACEPDFWDRNNLTFYGEWAGLALFGIAWFVKGRGGGFLLLDETLDQIISKPWWWKFS
jgi:heme A synthase